MFLDNEGPRRERPWWAVLLLAGTGAWHVYAALNAHGSGSPYALLLAVLGVALFAAARHPLRNEAALIAVVLGEVGLAWSKPTLAIFLGAVLTGILAVLVLGQAWHSARRRSEARRRPLLGVLEEAATQRGESLLALSRRSPILVICLRHFGCVFCREALARIAEQRASIQTLGTRIILVHQASEEAAEAFFQPFGLADLDRVSDPSRWLYFHLGLRMGGPWQLLGPKVWARALGAGLLKRHGLGRVLGDVRQMPGVFLIRDGVVLAAHVHRTAADNPDYRALAQCPS